MPTIGALLYYPIKGCAAVSVPSARFTPAGPLHDRSFMVVTADGVFRSQRRDPALATIRPRISPGGEHLTLRAPGVEALEFDVRMGRERCAVTLFGAPFPAIDQGEAAAGWLSEVLGAPSRLVRVPPEHRRVTGGRTPGTAGFADSSAVLITSRSALASLNARIAEGGGAPVPMDRFRPNLVVEGWARPHTEDRVRSLSVGGAELAYAKLDIRCVVTTVDQRSGAKSGPEPLRTLARYRRAAGGGVAFGMKASVVRPGTVSVGDEVAVTAWGESEL